MSGFEWERMYDEAETAKVRFIGFLSEHARYDFGVVYTNQFFGKPLVICMQTGRSTLLCAEEAENIDHIMNIFSISNVKEGEKVSEYLQKMLPSISSGITQY